jgi:hypothetical protein
MDYENRPPLCTSYGTKYVPDKDCLLYPEYIETNKRLGLFPTADRYRLDDDKYVKLNEILNSPAENWVEKPILKVRPPANTGKGFLGHKKEENNG